jgi:hypothetical protein
VLLDIVEAFPELEDWFCFPAQRYNDLSQDSISPHSAVLGLPVIISVLCPQIEFIRYLLPRMLVSPEGKCHYPPWDGTRKVMLRSAEKTGLHAIDFQRNLWDFLITQHLLWYTLGSTTRILFTARRIGNLNATECFATSYRLNCG